MKYRIEKNVRQEGEVLEGEAYLEITEWCVYQDGRVIATCGNEDDAKRVKDALEGEEIRADYPIERIARAVENISKILDASTWVKDGKIVGIDIRAHNFDMDRE